LKTLNSQSAVDRATVNAQRKKVKDARKTFLTANKDFKKNARANKTASAAEKKLDVRKWSNEFKDA
jgi:hypothetical protein